MKLADISAMSQLGHSRPGRANGRFVHVGFHPIATEFSGAADVSLRADIFGVAWLFQKVVILGDNMTVCRVAHSPSAQKVLVADFCNTAPVVLSPVVCISPPPKVIPARPHCIWLSHEGNNRHFSRAHLDALEGAAGTLVEFSVDDKRGDGDQGDRERRKSDSKKNAAYRSHFMPPYEAHLYIAHHVDRNWDGQYFRTQQRPFVDERDFRLGSRAAVAGRRMAQPVYPQLRKYPCVPALTLRANKATCAR